MTVEVYVRDGVKVFVNVKEMSAFSDVVVLIFIEGIAIDSADDAEKKQKNH